MPALLRHSHVSVDDYLAGETDSSIKHEYLGGVVHAMAGATNRHNRIASNALATLIGNLRGHPCEAFNSDTKVRIELINQTRFYYPDAMVVCQKSKDSEHFQQWPAVIVEVLSESTRRADLQEKKEAYLTIPSLKFLILVEPDEPILVIYRRSPDGGFFKEDYAGLDAVVPLPEIEMELKVSEIYDRLDFPATD